MLALRETPEPQPARNKYRHTSMNSRSIAKVPPTVKPPAVRGTNTRQATAVQRTCCNAGENQSAHNGHRCCLALRRPVPKLAVVIVSPAKRGAATGQTATVSVTCRNASESQVTRDAHGPANGDRPVTDLANGGRIPTVRRARTCQPAQVSKTCREGAEDQSGPNGGGDIPTIHRSFAWVKAPAVRCAGDCQAAGIKGAHRETAKLEAACNWNGRIPFRARPVAKLAVVILAPGVSRAINGHATRERRTTFRETAKPQPTRHRFWRRHGLGRKSSAGGTDSYARQCAQPPEELTDTKRPLRPMVAGHRGTAK